MKIKNPFKRRHSVQQLKSAAVASLTGLAILCMSTASDTYAAEGASSHYLPGANGDIFLTVAPGPGLQIAEILWYQGGSTDAAVLEGRISFGTDLDLFLNLVSLSYTFEQEVLGGCYTVGMAVPFGYGDMEGTITGQLGGRIEVSDDNFNLSDIAIIPFQMNWSSGLWSFKLSESIVAPTGGYDISGSDLINLGRNYWSFDTVAAVTWFTTREPKCPSPLA